MIRLNRRKKRTILFAVVLTSLYLMVAIKNYKPFYFVDGELVGAFSKEKTAGADTISIATFNAGVLYGKIWNQTVFEPVPYSEKRLEKLAEYLNALEVDVIGIQEIYGVKDKEKVIREVKDKYPYALYFKRSQLLKVGFNNGLLFLSRFPILAADFEMYLKNPLTEKLVVDKGILSILISVNDQKIILSNTHTTAGGVMYHTESDKANQIRTAQLQQTIELTDSLATGNEIKMILGDFNAGPGVSEVNYQHMIDQGYADSYPLGCSDPCRVVTWAPDNKLNANGHFPDSPPQRIDHIFIYKEKLDRLQILEVDVILDKEVVDIENGEKVSLSDHYGYLCKMGLK